MIRWLSLAVLLLAAPPIGAVEISGRVVLGDDPLSGMQVTVHADLSPGSKPLKQVVTDAAGIYHFDLPPGRYALFAADRAGRLFAFSGRNPVEVAATKLWLGLQAVRVKDAVTGAYDDEYSAGLEGLVTSEGRPLAGAVVYLYLDSGEGLKGQGYRMSTPTGADGAFFFDGLPESDYFLVARQRRSGQLVGPVLEGDRIGFYPGNPVSLKAGQLLRVELPVVEKQQHAATSETLAVTAAATIRGKVVDSAGLPAAGVHVFAYTDRVIGHQRPAALSSPTGADGRFLVQLPAAGTYYVGAREYYGDSPAPGERFGLYDGSVDHGLTVEAGEGLSGLKIIVEPIRLE